MRQADFFLAGSRPIDLSMAQLPSNLLRNITFAGASISIFFLVCIGQMGKRTVELASRAQKIRELSRFSVTKPDSLVKPDGYISASAYRHALESSAIKGQMAYISQWKSKNLAEAQDTVKAAASLYNKWDVVDPYTGFSKDNLKPFSSWGKVIYDQPIC